MIKKETRENLKKRKSAELKKTKNKTFQALCNIGWWWWLDELGR